MLTWTEKATEHVGDLVNPTPLMLGAGKDLLDRLPEAERNRQKVSQVALCIAKVEWTLCYL
jgi:hypothetical protein